MPFPSNPGVGAFPGSSPVTSGTVPNPPATAPPAPSSFGSTETGQPSAPPVAQTTGGGNNPIDCIKDPVNCIKVTAGNAAGTAADLTGLSAIGAALGKIADAFKSVADFFGGIKDGVVKVFSILTSAGTWKGIGLILAGGVLAVVGVLIWTGAGAKAERAAEAA